MVCLRSFQVQADCIVLNFLKPVQKVLRASGKEGIAIVQSRKNESGNNGFGGLNREIMAY